MAPERTRLRLVAAAHLPFSQGSCAAFLREGNIVGRHSWTWSSSSKPGRQACPAYAASPPPPRPPVRRVRPSGRAGCTPAPPLEGSAARRNPPAGHCFTVSRNPLDVTHTQKRAAPSPHPGQRPPNQLSIAGTRRALQNSTSGIRCIFLIFPSEGWQHHSIVSPGE